MRGRPQARARVHADTTRARGEGSGERWGARVRAAVAGRGTPGAASLAASPRQHTALRGGPRARVARATGPNVRFGPRHRVCRRVDGGNGLCPHELCRTLCVRLDIFGTVNFM